MLIEEMETVAVYDNVEKVWRVSSSVRKHITRLTRLFGSPAKVVRDRAGNVVESCWALPQNCVWFRPVTTRQTTPEQRAAASARFAAIRAAKGAK